MLNTLKYEGNTNEMHSNNHESGVISLLEWLKIPPPTNGGKDVELSVIYSWWECKMVQPHLKTIRQLLK